VSGAALRQLGAPGGWGWACGHMLASPELPLKGAGRAPECRVSHIKHWEEAAALSEAALCGVSYNCGDAPNSDGSGTAVSATSKRLWSYSTSTSVMNRRVLSSTSEPESHHPRHPAPVTSGLRALQV